MILITHYCSIFVYVERESVLFCDFYVEKFVLKALLYESCVYGIFPFERLINSNMRNALSLFILVM
jgi:hypothetical protein